MILKENSLLPIVRFDDQNAWPDVLRMASPHLDEGGLGRLRAALGSRVKSVVVERHYFDKDYRDTFANFHAKKFNTPDSRCVRLHFFSDMIDHGTLRDGAKSGDLYLGYSVIRPTRPNCVGRTLLSPEACGVRDCHLSVCTEKISIQGTSLDITGFPFISQDADVTVCAQSALWMLARFFSNRSRIYPEVYPFGLTNLTRDYSIGRLIPTDGLYIWQMAEALRQIGHSPRIYDRAGYGDVFEHLMYTYIESGIPVLAAFEDHVVVLFGHRSNYSAHLDGGDRPFIFSSRFNQCFIGNDDNAVPYQELGREGTRGGMSYCLDDVRQFVAALPEKVFLPAESFQRVLLAVLSDSNNGYKPRPGSGPTILRLFLTTGSAFKSKMAERGMGDPLVEDVYRNLPLPHFIWVCEISSVELYPKAVLGEIIWDATRNAYEPDGWIAVHYPDLLKVDYGSALNETQKLLRSPLSAGVDYPIFDHNLRTV